MNIKKTKNQTTTIKFFTGRNREIGSCEVKAYGEVHFKNGARMIIPDFLELKKKAPLLLT
jgi:hypothetical protein